MPQIDVDFEVWKELTSRRRSETHTYNEVIRELLDMDSAEVVRGPSSMAEAMIGLTKNFQPLREGPVKGIALRGLILPNGTLLRATHKGKAYSASIQDGRWISEDGHEFGSPSAAATAVTGNNVNGWRFWQAKRPSDSEWRILEALPKG